MKEDYHSLTELY